MAEADGSGTKKAYSSSSGDDALDVDQALIRRRAETVLAYGGYALMLASVFSFGAIVYLKLRDGPATANYTSWLQFVSGESHVVSLLVIAIVTALLGQRLLTNAQLAYTRTIPRDDLALVKQAVIDGKPEPIDQYVRLRSLSGWAGNFTKLGITGLPLTTVALTLVFAAVSLLPIAETKSASFLDLAKLTLGAFIGSFVQRQVEQRKQGAQGAGVVPQRDLIA